MKILIPSWQSGPVWKPQRRSHAPTKSEAATELDFQWLGFGARLLGCLRKTCFSSLEIVSSIPKYPSICLSLHQTPTGLPRSLQNRSDRNNKGWVWKETAGGLMKVQPHFTCIHQIICLFCTLFFVMWRCRCRSSALVCWSHITALSLLSLS